jgi:hypothetical protein
VIASIAASHAAPLHHGIAASQRQGIAASPHHRTASHIGASLHRISPASLASLHRSICIVSLHRCIVYRCTLHAASLHRSIASYIASQHRWRSIADRSTLHHRSIALHHCNLPHRSTLYRIKAYRCIASCIAASLYRVHRDDIGDQRSTYRDQRTDATGSDAVTASHQTQIRDDRHIVRPMKRRKRTKTPTTSSSR